MKNGNKKGYFVTCTNKGGEEYRDHKVYKTLDGAQKRLSSLVMSEELCLMAGFGKQHEYHIRVTC